MRTAFLDLETTRLEADRGIGFILCASMKLAGPKLPCTSFRIDANKAYGRKDRSGRFNLTDDTDIVRSTHEWLRKHDPEFLVWHYGDFFDGPYLNARGVALKLGRMPIVRTIDTWKLARYNLKLGSSSLANIAEHLDLPEKKMPVRKQVWQDAAYGDKSAMNTLVERCESDVRVLEMVYDKTVPMLRRLRGGLF